MAYAEERERSSQILSCISAPGTLIGVWRTSSPIQVARTWNTTVAPSAQEGKAHRQQKLHCVAEKNGRACQKEKLSSAASLSRLEY